MSRLVWTLACAGASALTALVLQGQALASPPAWSLRTNVSGKRVPAVLGGAVVLGGLVGILVALYAWELGGVIVSAPVALGTGGVLALLGAAGRWDDRRGDEAARGFRGHLRAGRVTGGVVKIAAGGLAGALAGALAYWDDPAMAVLTALAVALAANLVNLLDRAPGRAGKTTLVVALPLLAFGDADWAVTAAGAFGALAAVLPADLAERGMVGDTGANPLGGVVGLGLALSLDAAPLAVVVGVLLLLNVASERWSFSQVIERTPVLRAFDSIGRK